MRDKTISLEDVQEIIIEIITTSRKLENGVVTAETKPMSDLGFDSLDIACLISDAEEKFDMPQGTLSAMDDVMIDGKPLSTETTIADLCKLIHQLSAA